MKTYTFNIEYFDESQKNINIEADSATEAWLLFANIFNGHFEGVQNISIEE